MCNVETQIVPLKSKIVNKRLHTNFQELRSGDIVNLEF